MILLCKAIRTEGAKPAFRTLFREYGLPDAIRTDNGPPFASTGIHGLCELNVWWTTRDRASANPPCEPTTEPQHERMHKDMKREAASPPAAGLTAQQKPLNLLQKLYYHEPTSARTKHSRGTSRPSDGSLQQRSIQVASRNPNIQATSRSEE